MKNSMKHIWSLALIGSLVVLAACGGGIPTVEVKEIFVKADTGLDSNAGTLDKPLKTIKKALELWKPGRELMLIPSIYNEVSGETWPYEAPAGLVIKSTASGVILQNETPDNSGNLKRVAFNVTNAQIENVAFKNFDRALVQTSGRQTLKGVTFDGGSKESYALELSKSAEADWSGIGFKNSAVLLKDAATLNLKGASFEGDSQILTKGASQLNLENAQTPNGSAGLILWASESSKATVKTSSLNAQNNAIYVSGNAQVSLEGSYVSSVQSSAIRVDSGSLSLKDGSVSGSKRYGIEVGQGLNASINVDGSSIYGLYSGIYQSRGSLQVKKARITAQREAITIRGTVFFSLRDSTLETNGGNSNALYIDTNGQAIGIYPTDLGTAASPGGNTFKDSSSGNTRPLVYIVTGTGSTTTVPVSGNTWAANLQGANTSGKYAVGTNAVGPSASDKNYYASSGVTLNF